MDDANWLIGERDVPRNRVGLVISGDIVHSGSVDEYKDALRTLSYIRDGLGISQSQIAIVPGNHDVNWDDCKKAALARGIDLTDRTARLSARLFAEKLANFRRFFEDLTAAKFPATGHTLAFPGFLDLGFAVVGIDSTLPSTFLDEDNFGLVQKEAINEATVALNGVLASDARAIRVALLHHCPNPLADETLGNSFLQNAKDVRTYLSQSGFQLTICGHEHQQSALSNLRTGLQIFCTGSYGLNAGALLQRYSGDPMLTNNRYEIFFLHDYSDRLKIQCLLRKLGQSGSLDGRWTRDDDYGPDAFWVMPMEPFGGEEADPRRIVVNFGNPVPHPHRPDVFIVSVALAGPDAAMRGLRAVRYLTADGPVNRDSRLESFRAELALPKVTKSITVELVPPLASQPVVPISVPVPSITPC